MAKFLFLHSLKELAINKLSSTLIKTREPRKRERIITSLQVSINTQGAKLYEDDWITYCNLNAEFYYTDFI